MLYRQDAFFQVYHDGEIYTDKGIHAKFRPMAEDSIHGRFYTRDQHIIENLKDWCLAREDGLEKVVFFSHNEEGKRAFAREVKERWNFETARSTPMGLEAMAPGVNKGAALEYLAGYLDIPQQSVIAMGDGGNDREMLEYAGTGIAMGSAGEELKQVANAITGTVEENGVATALGRFL